MDVTSLGWLAFDERTLLVRIRGGLFLQLEILDHMLGCLGDDVANVIESAPSRAAADLAEIAHREDLGTTAIVLAEACQQDGADRHVHPDSQGVCSTNYF